MTFSEIEKSRRKLLTVIMNAVGGAGALATAIPFIKSMLPSEKTRVGGRAITVDLQRIETGKQETFTWRGKPIWILKRTPRMLAGLEKLEPRLRDPFSKVTSQQPPYAENLTRSIKQEYFVCIGVCTHLGCVPRFRPETGPPDLGSDWPGGYFCPCHGSRFDLAGRVYKGVPAPTNLVIPPHQYAGEHEIIIGED